MADRPDIEREVGQEVARIRAENEVVLPSGRCRVCQHPESRQKVNTLLGYGLSNSEILKFVQDINEKRPKNGQITLAAIRNHKQRHFAVQAETSAGYRRILERRKAQLSDEHEEAVTNLLTGMAYLDVVAQKGWQHLIDEETVVTYDVGLKAQLELERMMSEGAVEEKIAQMRRDVGLLEQAVKDVAMSLPDGQGEALLKSITDRIDELTGAVIRRGDDDRPDDPAAPMDVQIVDDYYDQDDDAEGFSPVMGADEGDSFQD